MWRVFGFQPLLWGDSGKIWKIAFGFMPTLVLGPGKDFEICTQHLWFLKWTLWYEM